MVLYSLTIQYSKTSAPKTIEIMVGMTRLELARDFSSAEFKSAASTDSATPLCKART